MPNFIRFTPDKLNSVSLSVLREIARQIGVKAPTSKSVPMLISEIIQIQRGEIQPVKSNRGAHSKPVDVSAYYEVEYEFTPEEREEYPETPVEPLMLRDGNVIDEKGILECDQNGVYHLRGIDFSFTDRDAVVPNEVLDNYDLRAGDFVKCKVVKYAGKKTVRVVLEVNGVPSNEYMQYADFSTLKTFYPNKPIEFNNSVLGAKIAKKSPVCRGQRGLIAVPNFVDKSAVALELAKAIKDGNSNLKTALLLVGEMPEEIDEIKRATDIDVVATRFFDDYKKQTLVAELLIESAKRVVERGEDIAIIINSATNLVKAYAGEGCFIDSTKIAPALMEVKRILANAVNTTRGSLTILSLVDYTSATADQMIFTDINGISNMRAVLTSEDSIDETLSYTKRFTTANIGANNE